MKDRPALRPLIPSDVLPKVDRLLQGGYRSVGGWSLGQICNHLATSVRFSVEGFPGLAPWPIRATLGKIIWHQIRTQETMTGLARLPKKFEPAPGLDEQAEAEVLRVIMDSLIRRTGPMAIHPLFGPLTTADWRHYQEVHATHHLSFLLPAAAECLCCGKPGAGTVALPIITSYDWVARPGDLLAARGLFPVNPCCGRSGLLPGSDRVSHRRRPQESPPHEDRDRRGGRGDPAFLA